MKIFELNWKSQGEKEWIAAHTNIEALKVYFKTIDTDIDELGDYDEIIELPEDELEKCYVVYDNHQITLKQWLEENKYPDVIGGTMY